MPRTKRSIDPAIGTRITVAREAAGLTITALAARCGFSERIVRFFEDGERLVGADNLEIFAWALGVTTAWLRDGAEQDALPPGPCIDCGFPHPWLDGPRCGACDWNRLRASSPATVSIGLEAAREPIVALAVDGRRPHACRTETGGAVRPSAARDVCVMGRGERPL